ncbi:DUF4406 domain-containing protein [Paracidovorax citrulli]|uniref:DUF4406 domain-containing protein n=2 Tax=Paracidovorax citrulli TaxID=80869 RepID=A1TMJ9_PARC0|nr:DUF4406 domain-containing protein [Paracidovorax citrulli]ABM32187.1 hypothetical protein Aave_1600 [Paracidovorax citrulli AAC00-1]ATG94799.1 DUF4406 domain-containing protein [Paracidovorax citrulli]PVY66377.1 uncharacterized protein DUF4406 [Paracidovorax citrulli]REG69452.1 uncharacterized protein DUF4406 [Paracidovorax citrulli]RLJ94006.1 uncharacterized protein DUF4406 [Paracidovorax citrulli]
MIHLYISGPMTGLPDFNRPAFHQAAAELRAAGYQVTNPAEKDTPTEAPWIEHMRADVKAMMDCDGVALLDGWSASRGANIEVHLAHGLGLPVHGVFVWRCGLVHLPTQPIMEG